MQIYVSRKAMWRGGVKNMKSSEWPETSRNTKIFDIWALFIDQNGHQSYKSCEFEAHFDPLNCIPQGWCLYSA